jgi:hypothetical protein
MSADTFFNTWGDDGVIYVQCDDTYGGWQAASANSNICFGSVDSYTSSLTGTNINSMTMWGGLSEYGSDVATYKSASLTSIHGTLYMVADRQHAHGWYSSQLIKSTNHGVSWTPLPPAGAQPYTSPMFTDFKFRVPFFFQYGQDYVGQTVDRSSEFVYALSVDQTSGHLASTPGTYSDRMFLGRVLISSIANLSAADWQFYQGGDGSLDANWGALSSASPVLTSGTQILTGQGTAQYLPAFGSYLLMNSFQTVPLTYSSTTWTTYTAPHPWGPWALIQTNVWDGATAPAGAGGATAFYFQSPVVKSVAVNGGRTFALFTNGNFQVGSMYTLIGATVTVQ